MIINIIITLLYLLSYWSIAHICSSLYCFYH